MTTHSDTHSPFQVVIAGGGVAGLEAALALRHLAPDMVAVTMIAPNEEFVVRPMTVREPFAYSAAARYPLADIAQDIGIELRRDRFSWLEPARRTVHTDGGLQLTYDALLLALGARRSERLPHALTLDDSRLDEQLHGLIQDLEAGYVHSLAFIVPSGRVWPLPIYELALMSAARAYDMDIDVAITLATPEKAPLEVFGTEVSTEVGRRLQASGIKMITSAHCEVRQNGHLSVGPARRELIVDRMIALPELYGPSGSGVPRSTHAGFISVDPYCRVKGLDGVYAAGDGTDFPVKHGGIAAQQADTAAESIAALAGAPITPARFDPVINGMLLTGGRPLYLSARLVGGRGFTSEFSETPLWSPPTKISAKYLAGYLEARERAPSHS